MEIQYSVLAESLCVMEPRIVSMELTRTRIFVVGSMYQIIQHSPEYCHCILLSDNSAHPWILLPEYYDFFVSYDSARSWILQLEYYYGIPLYNLEYYYMLCLLKMLIKNHPTSHYNLIFLYRPQDEKFSLWNHHKWLSWLFPLHLNTYMLCLQPL